MCGVTNTSTATLRFCRNRGATLTACLRKVQDMGSDPERVREGAIAKIAEFRRLRYPLSVLKKACNCLGAKSGEGMWITVRNALR